MKKKTFKKSTFEEIKKINSLYQQGYSINKIAKIFKKDRSTIRYWVEKKLSPIPQKTDIKVKKTDKKVRVVKRKSEREDSYYKKILEKQQNRQFIRDKMGNLIKVKILDKSI